ncbi:MAG TPA: hypothetical protein PLA50_16775, partial [Bacteroidia bacterium]|nr:hypothetical protein [Bacteroidia bacterium]
FPRGRVFPFIGFSGNAQWQKDNGYTAFGPVYGSEEAQRQALGEAKAAGLPFIYQIGLEMNFLGKGGKPSMQMEARAVREAILRQAESAMSDPAICWWYLTPEELRHWKPAEMEYLEAAKKALSTDPAKRPVWMYEPNHRGAEALALTGKYQDIIGKGFYANLTGFKDDRIWIRWSAEQEVTALRKLGRENGLALVMPELCTDPDPVDEPLIPVWARHDIYTGLIHGCKGVAIWSMFKRPEVAKTHVAWMDAYATVAKELTGPKTLGQVFLFGEVRQSLDVVLKSGPVEVKLLLGKARGGDASGLSDKEQRNLTETYPSFSSGEFAYGSARYLFLVNNSAEPIGLEVTGFPDGCEIVSLFNDVPLENPTDALAITLDKWEAVALRFSAPGGSPKVSSSIHRWKSADGREIEAWFSGLEGDQVTLIKDGQPFKLPLAKLAAESQELARKLASAGTER